MCFESMHSAGRSVHDIVPKKQGEEVFARQLVQLLNGEPSDVARFLVVRGRLTAGDGRVIDEGHKGQFVTVGVDRPVLGSTDGGAQAINRDVETGFLVHLANYG